MVIIVVVKEVGRYIDIIWIKLILFIFIIVSIVVIVVLIGELEIVICEVIIELVSVWEGWILDFFVILVIIGSVEKIINLVLVIMVIDQVIIGVIMLIYFGLCCIKLLVMCIR